VVVCFYPPEAPHKVTTAIYLPHHYFPPQKQHEYWAVIAIYGAWRAR
jgi:hypothetical protein